MAENESLGRAALGGPITKSLIITIGGVLIKALVSPDAALAFDPAMRSILERLGDVLGGVGQNLLSSAADSNQVAFTEASNFLSNEQISGHVGRVAARLLELHAEADGETPAQRAALHALAASLPDFWLGLCREHAPGTAPLDGQAFVVHLGKVLSEDDTAPALSAGDWQCVLAAAAAGLPAAQRPGPPELAAAAACLAARMGEQLAIGLTAADEDTQRTFRKVLLRSLGHLADGLTRVPKVVQEHGETLRRLISDWRAEYESSDENTRRELGDINANLQGGFATLVTRLDQIEEQIFAVAQGQAANQSFAFIINQVLRGFTGREWLLERIDQFQQQNWSAGGYIVLTGLPGQGKTAVAARLALKYDAARVFCRRDGGDLRSFPYIVGSIFEQLQNSHSLEKPVPASPANLGVLLRAVSDTLSGHRAAFLVVDALDEAAPEALRAGTEDNPLCLPPKLPPGVFVVLTSRAREDCRLRRVDPATATLEIDLAQSRHNLEDALRYIDQRLEAPELIQYVKRHGEDRAQLARAIFDKSEGNFMYLKHVLPEIKNGILQRTSVERFPLGLLNFYRLHWEDMRRDAAGCALGWKMALAAVLACLREGHPLGTIYEVVRRMAPAAQRESQAITVQGLLTRVQSADVHAQLQTWEEFLLRESRGTVAGYRLYHLTYSEFLRDEALVGEHDYYTIAEEALYDYLEAL